MKMMFESGASPTPPTPPSPGSVGYPTNGVLGGAAPTLPGAYAWYQMMQEMVGVITAAGLTPSETNLGQLQEALETRYQIPTGSVVATAASAPATGWLLCDGSLVSRAAFPRLFAAIGTTYGAGDGTTFGLPDMRGEFIRGADAGRGIDVGRALGSEQLDALQNIVGYLGVDDRQEFGGGTGIGAFRVSATTRSEAIAAGAPNADTTAEGGDGSTHYAKFDASLVARTADETRPRNVAMNYIIRT